MSKYKIVTSSDTEDGGDDLEEIDKSDRGSLPHYLTKSMTTTMLLRLRANVVIITRANQDVEIDEEDSENGAEYLGGLENNELDHLGFAELLELVRPSSPWNSVKTISIDFMNSVMP